MVIIKRFEVHSHTHYSNIRLLDCINKPKNLIDKAIENGLSGIAITDHECLSSHPEVNRYTKEIEEKYPDFKIALGNEIYLTKERNTKQKYYHFILISKNILGYRALRELSSRAWLNSYFDRGMERVVTLYNDLEEIVKKFPNSLIASTACLGGQLSSDVKELILLEKNSLSSEQEIYQKKQDIYNFIVWCQKLFKDDFYIECAPGCSKEQIAVNKRLRHIAETMNIKIVIGTDAHFLKKEDRYVHKSYLNSKNGEREVDDFYQYSYLQNDSEIFNNLMQSDFEEEFIAKLYDNSIEIYNKIEKYSLFHKQTIPFVEVENYDKILTELEFSEKYPILAQLYNSNNKVERYWVNQCVDKLKEMNKYNNVYLERLNEEARVKSIISEKLETNMFAYPVTLQHYCNLFWECGSTVGAGRGSACAALNHYLLGVTQLDPIEWDLPFFRYMNDERIEIGDVDLDLCSLKRPTIIQKIKEERGKNFLGSIDELSRKNLGCTLVATFGTESTKSAILTSCFKKGTKVDTLLGEKNIEEIRSGDMVKTLNGYEKVIYPTVFKGIPNIYVKTKNYINKGFYCTSDHEILTIKSYRRTEGRNITSKMKEVFPELASRSCSDKTYDLFARNFREISPVWTPAKDIDKEDYGLTLIDTEISNDQYIHWENDFHKKFGIGIAENIEISNDFCELIGIWIAEGGINKSHNQVSFTIHQKEEALKKRIIELMWKVFQLDNVCITNRKDSKAMTISYSSSQLAQFLFELFDNTGEWKDKRADNTYHYLTQWDKHVPKRLMKIDPQKQLQIVKGWFLGDGYAYKGEKCTRNAKWTTVSKDLARDMIKIFHRNYINPSVDIEERNLIKDNRCNCYNISLYGEYASILYNLKYVKDNFDNPLVFPIEIRRKDDIPVFYNDNIYMKNKLEITILENVEEEEVYCLKMPNGNFSVNNTIVHNCRGYRSEEFPNGIDVDIAQYLTSLIPSERGFLWPLNDVVYGNAEKDRKPNKTFINEVNKYEHLLEIMFGIENLINKRSSHASGVIFFDEDPYEFGSFMRTPKGEVITQYDLHSAEFLGMTKYDMLVTEVQDKITQCILLMQKDGVIEPELTLKQAYDKYLHPSIIPIDDKKCWDALYNNSVINVFQFDSEVGIQAVKKIKPSNILELSDSNGSK